MQEPPTTRSGLKRYPPPSACVVLVRRQKRQRSHTDLLLRLNADVLQHLTAFLDFNSLFSFMMATEHVRRFYFARATQLRHSTLSNWPEFSLSRAAVLGDHTQRHHVRTFAAFARANVSRALVPSPLPNIPPARLTVLPTTLRLVDMTSRSACSPMRHSVTELVEALATTGAVRHLAVSTHFLNRRVVRAVLCMRGVESLALYGQFCHGPLSPPWLTNLFWDHDDSGPAAGDLDVNGFSAWAAVDILLMPGRTFSQSVRRLELRGVSFAPPGMGVCPSTFIARSPTYAYESLDTLVLKSLGVLPLRVQVHLNARRFRTFVYTMSNPDFAFRGRAAHLRPRPGEPTWGPLLNSAAVVRNLSRLATYRLPVRVGPDHRLHSLLVEHCGHSGPSQDLDDALRGAERVEVAREDTVLTVAHQIYTLVPHTDMRLVQLVAPVSMRVVESASVRTDCLFTCPAAKHVVHRNMLWPSSVPRDLIARGLVTTNLEVVELLYTHKTMLPQLNPLYALDWHVAAPRLRVLSLEMMGPGCDQREVCPFCVGMLDEQASGFPLVSTLPAGCELIISRVQHPAFQRNGSEGHCWTADMRFSDTDTPHVVVAHSGATRTLNGIALARTRTCDSKMQCSVCDGTKLRKKVLVALDHPEQRTALFEPLFELVARNAKILAEADTSKLHVLLPSPAPTPTYDACVEQLVVWWGLVGFHSEQLAAFFALVEHEITLGCGRARPGPTYHRLKQGYQRMYPLLCNAPGPHLAGRLDELCQAASDAVALFEITDVETHRRPLMQLKYNLMALAGYAGVALRLLADLGAQCRRDGDALRLVEAIEPELVVLCSPPALANLSLTPALSFFKVEFGWPTPHTWFNPVVRMRSLYLNAHQLA